MEKELTLRFLSVCSGIEAASVAWAPLGWQAVAFSEIEKFPSAVLAHHYPDVPNLGDFTKIETATLGCVDILAGGTPCQAFSVAGQRQSLSDERGNLTLAFVELAHALSAGNGLRNVVWENVLGVLNTKDNAFGCFLGGLVGATAAVQPPRGTKWPNAGMVSGPKGRAAWRVLDAQYFGLAQRRRRVIVVADFGNGADPVEVLFERKSLHGYSPASREKGKDVAGAAAGGAGVGGEYSTYGIQGNMIGRHDDAGPAGSGYQQDLSFTLTKTDVHGVAFAPEIARCVATREGSSQDYETTTMVAQTVAIRGREGGATAELGGEVATALRASQGGGDKPHVLTTEGNNYGDAYEADSSSVLSTLRKEVGAEAYAEWGLGVLAALQSEEILRSWLHGKSIREQAQDFRSFVDDCPLPRQKSEAGRLLREVWFNGPNGRSPQGRGLAKQLAGKPGEALSVLPHEGASNKANVQYLREAREGARLLRQALSAVQEVRGSDDGQGKPEFATSAVRRLTARECERLMGFQFLCSPDYPGAWQDDAGRWWSPDYTAIPWRGKPSELCPDGPRYKALGNSWAVPKFRWLGERIQRLMP